jgi:hypothetical protein
MRASWQRKNSILFIFILMCVLPSFTLTHFTTTTTTHGKKEKEALRVVIKWNRRTDIWHYFSQIFSSFCYQRISLLNNLLLVITSQGGKSETSVLPKYKGSTKGVRGSKGEYEGVRREYEGSTREYGGSTKGVQGSTKGVQGSTRKYGKYRSLAFSPLITTHTKEQNSLFFSLIHRIFLLYCIIVLFLSFIFI